MHEVAERLLRLERRRPEPGGDEHGGRPERAPTEQRTETATRHLHREHPPPRTRHGPRESGGHGTLADATLSRDDHQSLGGERQAGRHVTVIAAARAKCQFAGRPI